MVAGGCGNLPRCWEIVRARPVRRNSGKRSVAVFGLIAVVRCLPYRHRMIAISHTKRGTMEQSVAENVFDWVRLIQAEFAEMPGLHLSKRQAQRMWNLDAGSTDVIFKALEASSFLRRMPNDIYIRADVGY